MSARRRFWVFILLAMLATPVAALAWFDATWFYPRLTEARSRVRAADPEERSPDSRLARFIEADIGEGLEYQVARIIARQPGRGSSQLLQGQWHRYGMASVLLTRFHCDKGELLSIYTSSIYVGAYGHGLQAASRGMYDRDLSALNAWQLAQVVSLPRLPGQFQKHPERLGHRARHLLEKIGTVP